MRPKYFRSTSKAPVLTFKKSREVVCATGYISRKVIITRPHDLIQQYSVMVIQLHTNCYSFTYPGGMEPESSLSAPGIRLIEICAHERTCVLSG